MYSLAEKLSLLPDFELSIATVYSGTAIKQLNIDGIKYFLIPSKKAASYDISLVKSWEHIINEEKPDIVHIHGTEYQHGLVCMQRFPDLKYVISIQGLVGVYERYFTAGISTLQILKNITFRDIIRWDSILQAKIKFKKRGLYEREYLQRSSNVIGRTNWDYVHSNTINPNIQYFKCNESLRKKMDTRKS